MNRISFSLAVLAAFSSLSLQAGITTTREGNNLRVEIDGKLFTEYRSDRWLPCLYPLMSPEGTHLTRRYPFEKAVAGEQSDHPHHVGFWFTHGDVNGSDFWHGRDGSRVVTKGFVGEPVVVEGDADLSSVSFSVDLEWRDKDKKAILEERRGYTITAKGKSRVIDVTCALTAAAGDVTFGETKEGSFAIRVAPTIRLKGEVARGGITNSEGARDGAAWGKRARWVAFHGPDSAGTPRVIALMDHPSNLRHPTWWHARDYGLLAANPFGPKSFKDKEFKEQGAWTLKDGETLTQRYRLVIDSGEPDPAQLAGQWKSFAG